MKNHWLKRLSRHLRGRWRSRVLAAHGVAIVTQTKNGLLAVQPGDFNVSRALLEGGEYDWKPIQWLKQLLVPKAKMIFAGAHVGALLVPLALACVDCEVLAFEPSPRNFRLLKMNLALNHLNAVTVRNIALGEAPGRIGFTENQINSGNSRVARSKGELIVEVATLDECLPADWAAIDLMVMDIEGSEVAAMRGASRILECTRYLYVEFAPEQLREQNSNATEFVELAARHFKSAYIYGASVAYFGPGQFAAHLQGLQDRRGLLLNILFTRDLEANPALLSAPA